MSPDLFDTSITFILRNIRLEKYEDAKIITKKIDKVAQKKSMKLRSSNSLQIKAESKTHLNNNYKPNTYIKNNYHNKH